MKRIISLALSFLLIVSYALPMLDVKADTSFEIQAGVADSIFANESIEIVFSDDVDASSISLDTVKLYKDGFPVELASEDLTVSGEKLTIAKAFEPYCTYIAEVLSGVKSTDGISLGKDRFFTVKTQAEKKSITLDYTKFQSALYTRGEAYSDATGDTHNDADTNGLLGALRSGSTRKDLYCNVNITEILDKQIEKAVLWVFLNGKIDGVSGGMAQIGIWKAESDFTPGVTNQGSLPARETLITTGGTSTQNADTGMVGFDVSEYVKMLTQTNKNKLSFSLGTRISNTCSVANENSTKTERRPYLEVTYTDDYLGVSSSSPESMQTDISVSSSIELILGADATGADETNITLKKAETGTEVSLSNADIIFDSAGRKITVTPPSDLSSLTVYDLKVSGLKTSLGEDFAEKTIRFKTASNPITDPEINYVENSGTSFTNIEFSDDYTGGVKIAGKLFALSNAPVDIKVIKSSGSDAAFEDTKTADSDGYFSFDVEVTSDSGFFKAYISSDKGLYGGIVSEEFEIYPFSDYTSVWNAFCGSDASAITPYLEKGFNIFKIVPQEEKLFDINSSIANLVAQEASFGAYNVDNINIMRTSVREDYIIRGFSDETDSAVILDAVELFNEEFGFSSISNIVDYNELSNTYKQKIAADFINTRNADAKVKTDITTAFSQSIKRVKLLSVFDAICNSQNYAGVISVIQNGRNAHVLELTSDELAAFEANKTNAAKKLVGVRFNNLSEFRTAFANALTSKENRPSSSITPSSSSGSGGGVTIVVPKDEVNNKEETDTPKNTLHFTDLSDYSWAEKEIEFLYKMGVIDGVGEKTFAPGDNLTREQFVKLLVEALEFENVNEDPAFYDVTPADWFYPYISTAKARGIVTGTGNGFGVGGLITREDLCTMAARALSAAGYKVRGGEASFTDYALVSDYAKEAVSFLAENGIINGMGDGSFNPKNNTTRAEAAVLLYRFSEYAKKFASTIWKAPLTPLDQVKAPTEEQILADIKTKICGKDVKHPYIYGTYDKLVEIKENLAKGEEWTVYFYNGIKKEADSILNKPVISTSTSVQQTHTSVEGYILNLMITYFIEGDKKYLDRAIKEFNQLLLVTDWDSSGQLDNTMTAAALAISYDWLYDYITEEQKTKALSLIKDKSVDIAYEYYKDPSQLKALRAAHNDMNIWCWRGTYNHICYNNSNLLIASLVLAQKYPEYAAFVISNNLYNVQPYLELVGRDGGHEEPVGYYGYTTGKILNALSALQSSLGTMYDYDRYYGFRTTPYYPLYMYGAGPFAFGDCTPEVKAYNSNGMYFVAKYSRNAELLGIIKDRFENGGFAKVILWYDEGELNNAEEGVELPLDKQISPSSKLQNIASFRDNWDINKGFFAAMYAGNANANGHGDPVSGAFAIHAKGEMFVTPQAIGDYSYPGYWESGDQTSERWQWYEKRAEANNCLVINPSEDPGQDVNTTAYIDKFETAAGGGYAISDLSGVYKDYVTSYKRGIKVHDSRSKIVIQDEAIMKEPSNIFMSVTTPAQIKILSEDTALLTIDNKKMAVKVYANVPFTFYEMAAEKLPTSPKRDEQKAIRAYRKIAISAENVTELNLMMEFIPIDTDAEIPESISEFKFIDTWTAETEFVEKSFLKSISVDGEAIADFDPEIRMYNIKCETIPVGNPDVKAVASEGAEVFVTYPEGEVKKAVIEVTSNGKSSYYEVLFTQKPKEIDINALTKYNVVSVTASDNDGNVPENAVDGDMNTRWSASGQPQIYPVLDMDLGSVKNIKAIGIAFASGTKRQSFFEIYVSNDGKEWTKKIVMGESSGQSDDFEYLELDTPARYVRYEGQRNSLNHWNSVNEIVIYGE